MLNIILFTYNSVSLAATARLLNEDDGVVWMRWVKLWDKTITSMSQQWLHKNSLMSQRQRSFTANSLYHTDTVGLVRTLHIIYTCTLLSITPSISSLRSHRFSHTQSILIFMEETYNGASLWLSLVAKVLCDVKSNCKTVQTGLVSKHVDLFKMLYITYINIYCNRTHFTRMTLERGLKL